MDRKLIIISNDALVREDIEYLKTKPCIKQLIEKGSFVESLKTVYPSITYCCHAAMITGTYPNKNGVHNNEVDGLNDKNWVWERKYIKDVKTIVDAFKEKGKTTANVFWPVLANDPNLDYNIPEYWSQNPNDPLTDALMRMGTSEEVIEEIVKPNLYFIEGHQRQHPYADEFVFACARDLILKYQPDLLVVHPAGIDGLRHSKGIFNDYVTEQLDYTYYWIEKIVRALKETGNFENTDIILTSDHGQMDIKRWCHPNIILRDMGLLEVDEKGNAINARAYIKSVGGSAQIFIVDKDDKDLPDMIYNHFKKLIATKMYGIERIYTKAEANDEEHLSGDFEFVIESDGYTSFGGKNTGDYYTSYDLSDYRAGRGTHGYHPDKGPQPCMVMYGPDFKSGVKIPRRNTVDMVATIAKIFDLDMPDVDGEPIEDVIAQN